MARSSTFPRERTADTDDDHWNYYIKAMRLHAKNQVFLLGRDDLIKPISRAPYPELPILKAYALAPPAPDPEVDAAIERITKETGEDQARATGEMQETLEKAASAAQDRESSGGKPNDEAWREQLRKTREEAKKRSDKIIDDAFDKLERIGEQHPESQGLIAQATEFITNSIMTVIDAVVNWIMNMAQAISDWFKNAVQNVIHFVKGVYDTIKSLFG
jgi:hypothetical protein